jgi:anthranilate synthase component I
MSHVKRIKNPGLDAFSLYIKATQIFGQNQAFLLDSLNGQATTPYEMSLLGVLPLIEIQVKSGIVTIHAEQHLTQFLHGRLQKFTTEKISSCFCNPFSSESPIDPVPYTRFKIHASDPMDVLEKIRTLLRDSMGSVDKTPFGCGFLGYFSFDAIHYLEDLPNSVVDDRGLPDVRFQLHGGIVQLTGGEVVIFNHLDEFADIIPTETLAVLNHKAVQFEEHVLSRQGWAHGPKIAFNDNPMEKAGQVFEDVPEEVFKSRVNRAKEYILNGDIFQVVISKRVRVPKNVHPYVAYARLRQKNPSPYMFMAEYPDMRLFGASPEVQFRSVGQLAQMKPIAGTSKGRGQTREADDELRQDLLGNPKDKAEHLMLVDLCRNDLGRVCQAGTVRVDEFMTVEAYAHLFHLVSTVNGVLNEGVNIFRALLSTFPAGTLSGAPKIRALEIIDELEDFARGPYGGFIGMVDLFGNANTAIIIRSVIETGDTYYVQAGAGIVADSDASEEWKECGRKALAILQILANRESGTEAESGSAKAFRSPTS